LPRVVGENTPAIYEGLSSVLVWYKQSFIWELLVSIRLGRPSLAGAEYLRRVLSFINFAAREINCKIVYYGAGLGGKTTNLQFIFDKTADKQKSKMISLATETDRTLFFDFLPLDLGTVRGFKTRFHLYTVPGQVFYDASRKLILRGVDGVVFVADSQEERLDANLEALDNLHENLKEHGYDFKEIPYVLQLNKRDLPSALPVPDLTRDLLKKGEPVFEAVAFQGKGVFETLKEIARLVLLELKKG
jgi:signal recognition particle receptor subunit beta